MLHILLWILKIIGILLAVLLGILLLGLVCVLFVPIRYRIEADGELGGEYPIRAQVKVSWLFHIISAAFTYREAAGIRIRIFCFTVFDSVKKKQEENRGKNKKAKEEKKHKKKQKKQTSQRTGKAPEDTGDDIVKDGRKDDGRKNGGRKEDKIKEDEETGKKADEAGGMHEKGTEEGKGAAAAKSAYTEITAEGTIKERTQESEETEGTTKETDEESKGKIKAFFLALRRFFIRLLTALKNIEYTIKGICDRIKKVIGNIRYYTEVLKSEAFRGAWEVSRRQLLRILRMLRPRICRIHLLAGTGDPAGTGQLLAFYGILYPLIGNHISVEADFENKVMKGGLLIRGRIITFVFLVAAFQLFVNKNIRRLLKMIKKEDM